MKIHDDEFDGLLSEALREERQAEPRVGLEGRVLAGVRGVADERRVGWWKWAAVAVAVLVAVMMWMVRPAKKEVVVKKEPVVEHVAPKNEEKVEAAKTVEKNRESRERRVVMAVAKKRTEERIPKFAEPSPMTEQEKALMLLARSYPQVVEQAATVESANGKLTVPEMKIPEIKIEPLETAETGGER